MVGDWLGGGRSAWVVKKEKRVVVGIEKGGGRKNWGFRVLCVHWVFWEIRLFDLKKQKLGSF